MTFRLLALFVASSLPALALEGPFGAWEAAGATLELKQEEGSVVGRLAAPGGPCPVEVGTELLRGTLLDDSLSAQVRLCLVAKECGDDQATALAVLLWTKQLSGGVHSKRPCAAAVRSLVLRRPHAHLVLGAPPAGERLSGTAAARSPRKIPARGRKKAHAGEVVEKALPPRTPAPAVAGNEAVALGELPGRPVGGDQGDRYDARSARRVSPGGADFELRQGARLLQQGLFERARAAFHAALAQQPARVEAYNGIGVTFYARGDLDEALAWYKRALEVDPKFGDAYYNMACAYSLRGDKELAFRYLRMAALNHYAEVEQLRDDPDLEALREGPQMSEIVALMAPPETEQ